MYKLVVLCSVLAVAAAKPSVVAYSAAVPAVSSVSQYSSSVVHGAPAVYSAPAVYGARSVYGVPGVYPSVYGAPAVYGAPVVAPVLAQPAHSPAVVLDAVRGVPLDTPEVVAARVAHYNAKALSGHHLRKRSLAYSSVVAPVAHSAYAVSPVVSAYSAPVVSAYSPVVGSPFAYSAYSAYAPRAYSVHPW